MFAFSWMLRLNRPEIFLLNSWLSIGPKVKETINLVIFLMIVVS